MRIMYMYTCIERLINVLTCIHVWVYMYMYEDIMYVYEEDINVRVHVRRH